MDAQLPKSTQYNDSVSTSSNSYSAFGPADTDAIRSSGFVGVGLCIRSDRRPKGSRPKYSLCVAPYIGGRGYSRTPRPLKSCIRDRHENR